MSLIDISREFVSESRNPVIHLRMVPLKSAKTEYTGVVTNFDTDSMVGSYIDFPGHIAETDDGRRADNVNPEDYFRKPATVLHFDRSAKLGPVSAEELRAANHGSDTTLPFLIINSLGQKDPHDVYWRGIYLDMSAVDWIIHSGCKVLVSDIYESEALEGVFLKLFQAGIAAVCEPTRLHKLGSNVLLSIIFPLFPGAQTPCRLLAEPME